MVTTQDIANYLSWHGARQRIDEMAKDSNGFTRWLDRLHKLGVDTVPLVLGSESARHIDLFALQVSTNPEAKLRAHDVRDTMPELRRYKGRSPGS